MNNKMPVSQLQELMVALNKSLPVYLEEPFGTQFKCSVNAGGMIAVGIGSTKKAAKHESARLVLLKLGQKPHQFGSNSGLCMISPSIVNTINNVTLSPRLVGMNKNYVGEMNELASKRGLSYPEYEHVSFNAISGEFVYQCNFANTIANGTGKNKKDAKQESARIMLEMLKSVDLLNVKLKSPVSTVQNVIPSSSYETEKVINLFNSLSLSGNKKMAHFNANEPVKTDNNSDLLISFEDDDLNDEELTVEEVETCLRSLRIDYTVKFIQCNPCVASFVLNKTNVTLLAVGKSKESAKLGVLKEALQLARAGSLSNDIINWDINSRR